jgi:hypothetical protein
LAETARGFSSRVLRDHLALDAPLRERSVATYMSGVAAPSVLFLVDARLKGVEYALTAPPLVIWGSLVALSGARGNSRPGPR